MSHELQCERVISEQSQMAKDIGEIKVILARQEESLRHHIRRTELAEENIELLRAQVANAVEKLEKDFEPVKKHVYIMDAGAKLIGGLSVGITVVVGLLKIFSYIL